MALTSNIGTHRHWEDWCSMAIGAAILMSPVITQIMDRPDVTLNAVSVGLLVMLLAWQELMLLETWEEYLEVALGLWLVISPWIIGYSDQGVPTAMHVALGGAVAALGAVEFCQDWRLSHQSG
jgi:SPW repeat-containing protein